MFQFSDAISTPPPPSRPAPTPLDHFVNMLGSMMNQVPERRRLRLQREMMNMMFSAMEDPTPVTFESHPPQQPSPWRIPQFTHPYQHRSHNYMSTPGMPHASTAVMSAQMPLPYVPPSKSVHMSIPYVPTSYLPTAITATLPGQVSETYAPSHNTVPNMISTPYVAPTDHVPPSNKSPISEQVPAIYIPSTSVETTVEEHLITQASGTSQSNTVVTTAPDTSANFFASLLREY